MSNIPKMKGRFQQKIGTTEEWQKAHEAGFVPLEGEIIIYQDYKDGNPVPPRHKVGDGNTLVGDLPFSAGGILELGESPNSGQHLGTGAKAIGIGAVAFGKNTTTYGPYAFIEGASTSTVQTALDIYNEANSSNYQLQDIDASNLESFWGSKKDWNKNFSFARTLPTTDIIDGVALEGGAHVEGLLNVGIGSGVHAEGYHTWSLANAAHTEGYGTKALADGAHAEGGSSTAKKAMAHAEGQNSIADGVAAHAEGYSYALENFTHSEGYLTYAKGKHSHAEGWGTIATADDSHVQGKFNIEDTAKRYAHIQGGGTQVAPKNIHTIDWYGNTWYAGEVRIGGTNYDDADIVATSKEVQNTHKNSTAYTDTKFNSLNIKNGPSPTTTSIMMPRSTIASYNSDNAAISSAIALGESVAANNRALAHGYFTTATGKDSVIFGGSSNKAQVAVDNYNNANGTSYNYLNLSPSEAEEVWNRQNFSLSNGRGSLVEGRDNLAVSGLANEPAHAEGSGTKALTQWTHAEGRLTKATGWAAHAEGRETLASAHYSHAGGYGTKATAQGQTAIGTYNRTDTDALFIVGNGSGDSDELRSNAFVVKKDGTVQADKFYVYNNDNFAYANLSGGLLNINGGVGSGEIIIQGWDHSTQDYPATSITCNSAHFAGTVTVTRSLTIGNTTLDEHALSDLLALL